MNATIVQIESSIFLTMVEYKERLVKAMGQTVTVQQLADALGVSYQAVKKVVDGKSAAFTAQNNAKAARFLGVNPDWLATGEGSEKESEIPLRKERDGLSVEAVKHAMAFDKLSDGGKRTWRTVLMTVRSAVSNEHVEKSVPLPPEEGSIKSTADRLDEYKNKRLPYTGPERRRANS